MLGRTVTMLRALCVGALVAGLGMVAAGVAGFVHGQDVERAHRNAEVAGLRAAAAAAALAQAERFRAQEAAWAARTEEIEHARQADQSRARAALAAVVADRDRLRGELAAFAAGGGPAADSVDACHQRAAELAGVVGDALQAHAQCTGAAEAVAADLRALRAWGAAVSASTAE